MIHDSGLLFWATLYIWPIIIPEVNSSSCADELKHIDDQWAAHNNLRLLK